LTVATRQSISLANSFLNVPIIEIVYKMIHKMMIPNG
jgi:hypothetical protein